jgi:hypothetical protein
MQAVIEWTGLAAMVAASFAGALALAWLSLRCLLGLAAPGRRPSPAAVTVPAKEILASRAFDARRTRM